MTRPYDEGVSYCQAVRCSRTVAPGSPFCSDHWAAVPEVLRLRLARALPLPPRLLFAPMQDRTVALLELLADAIAAVARGEGVPEWSTYRFRVERWRTAESLARRGQGGAGRVAAAEDDGITFPAPEGLHGAPRAAEDGGGP